MAFMRNYKTCDFEGHFEYHGDHWVLYAEIRDEETDEQVAFICMDARRTITELQEALNTAEDNS